MYNIYCIIACILLCYACGGGQAKSKQTDTVFLDTTVSVATPKYLKTVQFVFPQKNTICHFNEKVKIVFAHHKRYKLDSSQLFFNNKLIARLDSNTFEYIYQIPKEKIGHCSLKVIVYHPDNKRGVATTPITIYPDEAPSKLSYTLVNSISHDPEAYTQGLVYHNGYMYEGTGQYGTSSLRKINMKNNQINAILNIESDLFGEGITIYKDQIYQLTWKSRKGFVYDLNSFSLKTTFNYDTQGWGITTIGDHLIMSDGSHYLHLLNPENLSVIKSIEVYDNKGKVENLNELEYINGLIWANVWLSDRIVLIDPKSGIVKAELQLSGLLSAQEKASLEENDDVLNGIAYNPEKGTVYVTGKRWPKLFELKINDKY